MDLIHLLQTDTAVLVTAVTALGLIVGSFLNVVVHRLPLMMEREWRTGCREVLSLPAEPEAPALNLVTPRSRCPACGHAIGALENVPVLSYLVLGGRCKACRAPISMRYPGVEIVTGALSAMVAWHFGFGVACAAALLLTWALIALTFIDFDTQTLPDAITLPFLWLGLAFNYFGTFVPLHDAVMGAIVGYGTLWLVYHAFRLVTGKEGMGYGDFKLLGLLGAWQGWSAVPMIILLSSFVGAVVGIVLIRFRAHGRDVPIPFGPYLAAAGWLALLWGDDIKRIYFQWSGLSG